MRIDARRNRRSCFWLMLLLLVSPAWALQPTPVREADAICAQCHREISRSYLATPMANASGLAAENLRPGVLAHSRSATEYQVLLNGNQGEIRYRSTHPPDIEGKLPLLYFLGSGHLGTTYIYSIGNFLFESPVAWYAPEQGYDMKPGLAEIERMPPPLPMQSGCLRCHMSSVQPSDPGTINRYGGLPFLHTGITCESCHGDSTRHVQSRGKDSIVNPVRLKPGERDSVCISCHLEGDVTVARAGHSALDYRPGESISAYLAFYVREGANLTDRAVSEVEQLGQSTCKRTSGDSMSCMSCHDPHYTPDTAHRVAFFRGKCLACHHQPGFAATHHPENQDCTSCHMPRSGARNILHVAWTDHRIRRQPAQTISDADSVTGGELVPIFSPGSSRRDLAMANYKALLEGERSREVIVWKQLNELQGEFSSDKDALDALGNVSAERGEYARAEQSFRSALQLDPADLTGLSNLGILLAKEGKLKESLELLQTAFEHNQDVPGLAKNLARVQCMAGDGQAARATLGAALAYGPGLGDLRQLLTELGDCRSTTGPATAPQNRR
ncbi:MAG TPA: tetratricopeptide repeat protein [Terracidiphilus sp.]